MNIRYVRGPNNRSFRFHNRAVCPLAVLLAFCCCLTTVSGQWLEATTQPVAASRPGFDPKDVFLQVRSIPRSLDPSSPGLDNGEFLVDTSGNLVPAPYGQSEPAIAFDGANFLVVWTDNRVGMDYSDIYGARVTPQGTVLDTKGFVLSQPMGWKYSPAVGFDGSNFLVVWENLQVGSYYTDIYGARVTPQGSVLDPSGIVISQAEYDQFSPALDFDGTNFLVVWEDQRHECDIYGARVTPQGSVLDPSGFVISQAPDSQCAPALGFDGANLLVAWQDFRSGDFCFDTYGARVTPQGTVLDHSGFVISDAAGSQVAPAVGFDGSNFLVVWEDHRYDSDIYGARVTPQGTVLDPSGLVISQATYSRYSPAVDFDGGSFLVTWDDYRSGCDIYGARVTPQGTVLDPPGIVISQAGGDQKRPALGSDGANCLVVWEDYRGRSDDDAADVYGTRVTPQGTVLDSAGIAISLAAERQYSPDVGFDGANFLVVWENNRDGSDYHDICGARVTPQGMVLDPAGFVISQAVSWQYAPALAFDGTNYLVVWQDYRGGSVYDIYGARVTTQGTVLDPAGLVISRATNSQESPALAFDGTNYLVVWEDHRSDFDIYGARVTPQGMVLDSTGILISQPVGNQCFPAVGFDGANFLVVWGDYSGYSDLYGARVSPQGTVLDPSGIVIAKADYSQYSSTLAFDGTNFLVVWLDGRNGGYADVYGTRVTPQGTVLDTVGIVISHATHNIYSPALGFSGSSYLVVWDESRGGHHTYGARVTPAGVVTDSGPVVRQEGDQATPALARGNGSQLFLVYQGWTRITRGKAYNTQRIWGKMDPNPSIEEVPRPQASSYMPAATILRGMLYLPEHTGSSSSYLLDASGRKVLDLRTGANDVRALAPGVYFVREAQTQAVRKIVVAR